MRGRGAFAALAAFAASPQGRRLMQQARDYVTSPEGKRKIAELRGRVKSRRPR
jgi:hypothetical protein